MLRTTGLLAIAVLLGITAAQAEDKPMGFFVTSVGMGDGANLGGDPRLARQPL